MKLLLGKGDRRKSCRMLQRQPSSVDRHGSRDHDLFLHQSGAEIRVSKGDY